MSDYPQYWLAGGKPVMFEETPEGGLRIKVWEEELGKFLFDSRYRSLCLYDRSDWAKQVTREEYAAALIAQGGQP